MPVKTMRAQTMLPAIADAMLEKRRADRRGRFPGIVQPPFTYEVRREAQTRTQCAAAKGVCCESAWACRSLTCSCRSRSICTRNASKMENLRVAGGMPTTG